MESSLCEKPERHAPRRLSDHLGLEGLKQKVHSLVDKVYSRTKGAHRNLRGLGSGRAASAAPVRVGKAMSFSRR